MPMKLPVPPSGATVGTYENYEQAQRAVDFLSDEGFPVQHVTIVGNGLRLVERVTGRLDRNRAAATGAMGGAWWGFFIGAVLTLFASEEANWLLLILLTTIAGAVFGAIMGIIAYQLAGGAKRDFTSISTVVATTYDLLCHQQHAEEAQNLLAKLAWRS